jgi:hypothetical protein
MKILEFLRASSIVGVNVRNGDEVRWADCDRYPSITNRNVIQQVINPDWGLVPRCQKAGQSYCIDCPGRVLPIPRC